MITSDGLRCVALTQDGLAEKPAAERFFDGSLHQPKCLVVFNKFDEVTAVR